MQHTVFHSPHEGYAVLLEEAEEVAEELKGLQNNMRILWECVKMDDEPNGRNYARFVETKAIRIAAEAIQWRLWLGSLEPWSLRIGVCALGTNSSYGEAKTVRHPYTKKELRDMLPKVGDHRMEKMSASTSAQLEVLTPQPCTVVEVNEEHYWYRVRFDKTGICQCFKLPPTNWTGPRVGWA